MGQPFIARLKHAWNAFRARDETPSLSPQNYLGMGSNSYSPTRSRSFGNTDRSIVTALYNRIAMDVSAYDITHAQIDGNGRYVKTIESGLQKCLTIEANKDQTGRAFIQDLVVSMFDEGVVAVVPIDIETEYYPPIDGSYDIRTLRTGKIVDWFPDDIRVEVYNDRTGTKERILVAKKMAAIIENPLYSVMNEPNSTLKRLMRKLSILDVIDEQSGSGKLDIIIQLPYTIKTDAKKAYAESRRKSIEEQLSGGKYGIAYTDGSERITQLNRPAENSLLAQVTYLTNMVYGQLGLSEDIFTGTADDKSMLNYYNRTVAPVVTAITEELRRKFVPEARREEGHTIMGFRDNFRLVPASEMAKIGDTFVRNEILSPNDVRAILGMKPSADPKSDKLRNPNMPEQSEQKQLAETNKEV